MSLLPHYNTIINLLFSFNVNFLIYEDPNVRKTLTDLQWKDAIIICDEAHNLEQVCEDASSFELKPEVLANSISECDDCLFMMSSEQNSEGAIGGKYSKRKRACIAYMEAL